MSSPALSISTFVYSRIIRWYPSALRVEYGEDMVDVFTENLETAWRRASWQGLVRAWLAITQELVEVVLPYQAARVMPVLMAVVCSIVFYVSLLAAIDPNRHCDK